MVLVPILAQARCLLTQLYGFTSGPASSPGSSGHRLALGLLILAPVINDHQQAQSDADVNDDDDGYCCQVHFHTALTHCRAQGWRRERNDPKKEIIPGHGRSQALVTQLHHSLVVENFHSAKPLFSYQ